MLHSVSKTKEEASMGKPYIAIKQLAKEIDQSYDVVYGYIYRLNQKHPKTIRLYAFEAFGRTRFVSAKDAEYIRDVFLNMEDHMKEV